ncbi:hypothetical protein ACH5RR_036542 [Cinchona calisaya]|uniref:NAC domain-containing protein n=1 Tax=Cinchona calisaya TaxID=153742 RepID=A0ABD2Y3L3_9GENT
MNPLQNLPLGFRFKPTNPELLMYLQCKVNDVKATEERRCLVALKEIDIYEFENPNDLFKNNTDEEVVYVFTKFKKIGLHGKRAERRVGGCTWKGNDKGLAVEFGETCKGKMKSFSYQNKNMEKLGFNMKEFSLDEPFLRHAKDPDYVLCKIKRKSSKAEKKSRIDENLQEGIFDYPLNLLDDDQVLPMQTAINNGHYMDNIASGSIFFGNFDSNQGSNTRSLVQEMIPVPSELDLVGASTSMVPNYTQVQQYQDHRNETINSNVPVLLPAEGYQNQFQHTSPSNQVCQNHYLDLPYASAPNFEGNQYREDQWPKSKGEDRELWADCLYQPLIISS